MKRRIVIAAVINLIGFSGFSQETNIYTFFMNVVNDHFKPPMIGFVNIAKGEHKGVQLGFINWNAGNFKGIQMGMVNTLGGELTGAQLAYINTAIQQTNGIQAGFINTAMQDKTGVQFGFINTVKKEVRGAQFGFINTALQSVYGAQIGFVNSAIHEFRGTQIGFVNLANRNKAGFQLGFINYADSLEKGIPIGFLSFVRRGGYMAIEVGFSDFFPVTIGFKTGVEKFYTTLYLAYNPSAESSGSRYASGFGFGSIIPIRKSFFFNPELQSFNTIEKKNNRQLTSFVPLFGLYLNRHFSITAGPSVTWSASYEENVLLKPVFNIIDFEINDDNRIFVGARAGIRYRF
ncbi:MAG: hypothetical protein LBE79_08800 [Tannerella sp.]|jgi:hypothetical protein|nr:hypothetical protein [Tannerella sp.]